MKEGVTISPEHNKTLLDLVEKHFENQVFVYITHRIHSYSINPTVYFETSKIPNLIGFCVVSDNPLQKNLTEIEKNFFNKEFKHFNSMEMALRWKTKIILEYKKHFDSNKF